ncbi:MAG: hypothetical protein A3C71_01010 [Candidatus Yanofskybacteria bacterium RIFCSPHIGHO2_02_FULL_43_15c]|uniref:Uncharacterized protein n=1 Tax=Candidatus Yanofskybacteria bacterium RIFCSPHIGHO2_02_FULL_43_15c TaxID=1802679 RepID=A0A1F8FIG2_9BACT|nr:MAG: hypothetical protein A3C71_01010 [Candidatus Yanofskybacteria bacterium RIFCSPHIGHO2_02_FULL_43_15c]
MTDNAPIRITDFTTKHFREDFIKINGYTATTCHVCHCEIMVKTGFWWTIKIPWALCHICFDKEWCPHSYSDGFTTYAKIKLDTLDANEIKETKKVKVSYNEDKLDFYDLK